MQMKAKTSELRQLRQEMADRVGDLEAERDAELERIERQYQERVGRGEKEGERVRARLAAVLPELTTVREECL